MPEQFMYTCSKCSGLLLIERDEDYVKSKIGTGKAAKMYFDHLRFGPERKRYPNDSGVWLWRDFILPGFPRASIISLKEGQTDLFEIPDWMKKQLGLNRLYIKMEGQAPSESFKDRGMTVAVSDALRLQKLDGKIAGISCASTGDTSAAAAVYSAYVQDRLRCLVLVPHEKVAAAQLFQAMAHGAAVRAIQHPDGFDGCMQLIQEFTQAHPEYLLVNSKNDMRVVGQETIALEILQDLGWEAPDWISIPVGNGGNISALLNSLLRAKEFNLIKKLPGVIAAQTASADTLVRWAQSNYKSYKPGKFTQTVASAMNINDPVSFPRFQKLYKHFQIKYYRVPEPAILETWAQFTGAGANVCPQSAVALNAVMQAKAKGIVKANDTVVAISTASAIKFSETGVKYHMNSNYAHANPYKTVKGGLRALEKSL